MYEVELALKHAKLNKAAGLDGPPNETFKNDFSAYFVTKLFNLFFLNSFIPSERRTSIIKPIPKHSAIDKIDPLQYRGIYVLPCLYKIYSFTID